MKFAWLARRGRILAGVILSCAVCWGPQPARAQTDGAKPRMTDARIVQDLRAYLQRLAAQDAFSGAVLLAEGDHVLFAQAYGFADHAFNAPNTVDTKFNVGSMGKMFTAVAILQLAQQGKLSLSDTVLKLVPDYPDKDIAAKVTVYELLTHTAGMPDIFNDRFFDSSRAKYRSTEAYLSLITGKPLLFEPGTRWDYSSGGYVVLGLIIERVSGESYYKYVREHVFKPANMLNTDNYNVDDDVPNLALGYTRLGDDNRPQLDRPRRTNVLMNFARGGSAGGAYSTVEDLLHFSLALQRNRLLSRKYTELEMTGKVRAGRPGDRYGFGMAETLDHGVRIVGHSGGFPGANGQLDMYPESGYTVVVLSNYDDGARPVIGRLRLELTGQTVPHAVRLSTGELRFCIGKYAPVPPPAAPGARMGGPPLHLPPLRITSDRDGLLLDDGRGGPPHRFLPLSSREFFDEASPEVRLSFQKNSAGQIVGLTLTGVGPMPLKAARLP